jgi:hypothetical protein
VSLDEDWHVSQCFARLPLEMREVQYKRGDAMNDLIESSEFGDWLMNEMSDTLALTRSGPAEQAVLALQRLKGLKTAKKVLLEFLTLQVAMLETASALRSSRSAHRPADGGQAPAASH